MAIKLCSKYDFLACRCCTRTPRRRPASPRPLPPRPPPPRGAAAPPPPPAPSYSCLAASRRSAPGASWTPRSGTSRSSCCGCRPGPRLPASPCRSSPTPPLLLRYGRHCSTHITGCCWRLLVTGLADRGYLCLDRPSICEQVGVEPARCPRQVYPMAGAVLGTCLGGPVGVLAGIKIGGLAAIGEGGTTDHNVLHARQGLSIHGHLIQHLATCA